MKPSERIQAIYAKKLDIEAAHFVSRWQAELVVRERLMVDSILEFMDEAAKENERAVDAAYHERQERLERE